MPAIQKFGKAEWTEKKLNIFISYLEAYLDVLKKQPFKKIYIDAFAGTGKIEVRDGDQILEGSAKRALEAKEKFDQYFFIEKDDQKVLELQAMVDAEFPQLKSRITVYCEDANDRLAQIVRDADWQRSREFSLQMYRGEGKERSVRQMMIGNLKERESLCYDSVNCEL